MNDTHRRHPNIANLDEVPLRTQEAGTRFGFAGRMVAAAAGGRAIGCSWYEVPPGRSAFPYHYHCSNEEALFVLEGTGALRIGDGVFPVRPGDYMCFPVGPSHAHRLDNTGDGPLRYLCISTQNPTEVVGYPDSDKIAALARPEPTFGSPAWVRKVWRDGREVGYWEGEDVG